MENEELVSLKKRSKVLSIGSVILLIFSFLAITYGFLQRASARQEYEKQLRNKVELEECKAEVKKQKEFAANANLEAEYQKQIAAERFVKILELEKKIK
jgi:hypothetical protein